MKMNNSKFVRAWLFISGKFPFKEVLFARVFLVLAILSLCAAGIFYSCIVKKDDVEPVAIEQSANFANLEENPPVINASVRQKSIFSQAARSLISDRVNPWITLEDLLNPEDPKNFLIDFINQRPDTEYPKSAMVTLSVREYGNPGSILMEAADSSSGGAIVVASGHLAEEVLYATYSSPGHKQRTFALLCGNGLVKELIPGNSEDVGYRRTFQKEGSLCQTGMPISWALFLAKEHGLSARFVPERSMTDLPLYKSNVDSVYMAFVGASKLGDYIFDIAVEEGDVVSYRDGGWTFEKGTDVN